MAHHDSIADHARDMIDDITKHPDPADRQHLTRAFVEMPVGEALQIIGTMTGNKQLADAGKAIRDDGIDQATKGGADASFYLHTAEFWTHFV